MKAFFLLLVFCLSLQSNKSHANWTNTSFTEPAIGCAVLGGTSFIMGQSSQMSAVACAVGALAGYALEGYYSNKVADRYENEFRQMKSQLNEIVEQRAMRSSSGLINDEDDIILKRTIVPSQRFPDGSIQYETYRIQMDLPGRGVITGD